MQKQNRRTASRYAPRHRLVLSVVALCTLFSAGCQGESIGQLAGTISFDGGDEIVSFDVRAGYLVDSTEVTFKTREPIRALDFIIEYEEPRVPLAGTIDLSDDSDHVELSCVQELANGHRLFHTVRSGELVVDHYPSLEGPTWSGRIVAAHVASSLGELDATLDAEFFLEIPRDTLALALE